MRVTVIGAGVAGLTTALALAERGAAVEVLEQGAVLGASSCSRYAGGMLAPWCERASAEELVLSLGREALGYWPARLPSTLTHGSLVLAQRRDDPGLDRFARQTGGHRAVDAEGIAELEPDLAGRFRRGLFFPDEAHLDPRAALPALAALLAARGVPIRFGVDGRDAGDGAVVDCRGLAARDRLPGLRGVKGEMLLVQCPDVTLSRPVRLLHPRFPLYVVPRGEGLFMVGATTIESDERGRISARSMVELLNAAYALHPAFAEAEIVETGCDARPAFPDNLPRIVRQGATVFVNGLYRHGFLLSPALARMAADVVLDGAFHPEVMHEDHGQWRAA
jgi:glycine oxidase